MTDLSKNTLGKFNEKVDICKSFKLYRVNFFI
jgi:hypothetical protein